MNLIWALVRSGIASAVRGRLHGRSRGGNSGSAGDLLLAAALAALVLAAPGLFVVLLLAGQAPAAP